MIITIRENLENKDRENMTYKQKTIEQNKNVKFKSDCLNRHSNWAKSNI